MTSTPSTLTTLSRDRPYRSDLEAALRRLDALQANAPPCEACAERAERAERRRATIDRLARSSAAALLLVLLTVVAIVALLAGLLAFVLFLSDAGGSVAPKCADFGCGGWGARPENIPAEVAAAAGAFGAFWLSVAGVGRCFSWLNRRNP